MMMQPLGGEGCLLSGGRGVEGGKSDLTEVPNVEHF